MSDWTTRDGLLTHIKANYALAYEDYEQALTKIQNCLTDIAAVTDPNAKAALTKLYNAWSMTNVGVAHLLVRKSTETPPSGVPYFLENYTIAEAPEPEEYELTWKKIIMAWSEISDAARMWTITSIDQMRQSIWHKPTKIKWDENPFE